jgi:adenylylsulfate kinase-like enzyme
MTTILPQTGFVVWLTGIPVSGKSTTAQALRTLLAKRGVATLILDSDELWPLLIDGHPLVNEQDQEWLYGVLAKWVQWLTQQGQNVIVAATADHRQYRDTLRHMVPHFTEVYLHCDEDLRQERAEIDPQITSFIPSPFYEPPLAPELYIDTSDTFPNDVAYKIFLYLRQQPYLA